jgi:hypothetical protein
MLLSRMTDNSIWIYQRLSACVFSKQPEAKEQILSVGNDALLGALTQDEFLLAIRAVCRSDRDFGLTKKWTLGILMRYGGILRTDLWMME